MACLGEKPFHIVKVEDSTFTDNSGVTKKGKKITTKETFKGSDLILTPEKLRHLKPEDVESFKAGEYNKFHTNRIVIVKTLSSEKMQEDLTKGEEVGPYKFALTKPQQGGNDYWMLVDA